MKNKVLHTSFYPTAFANFDFVTTHLNKQMDNATAKSNHPILPEILMITSFPPRQCGIATYSQDLIAALNSKYQDSFTIATCAIETNSEIHNYTDDVKYILNIHAANAFTEIAKQINDNKNIKLIVVQHEFGLFENNHTNFLQLLKNIHAPIVVGFHTVLSNPSDKIKLQVQQIAEEASGIIIMTQTSAKILHQAYYIDAAKINVIAHGTHLVQHLDKDLLKLKYQVSGRTILSTFGLLSAGKDIETTLRALPAIVKNNATVLFLIIGKTHPTIVKNEGEEYRNKLQHLITALHLQNHVQFVNQFLSLDVLLEYLQMTDIYLFTSKDPHQAVSGTFSYALSCGCPIISTPIPHSLEVLQSEAGVMIDFENEQQLATAVVQILENENWKNQLRVNALRVMAPSAWQNVAIAHAQLFEKVMDSNQEFKYAIPAFNLDHIKKMTTSFGIIQFSKLNSPDVETGYTLDDNARALIALCQHYQITKDTADLPYLQIYFQFIKNCLQADGTFLNYIDEHYLFTAQNNEVNLEDAHGRAIWALGYFISQEEVMPKAWIKEAKVVLQEALIVVANFHSTRALSFIIKGLYSYQIKNKSETTLYLIQLLANRLVQMYKHESDTDWLWYESYLTYANSILPEALLCAWMATGNAEYQNIAKASFDFLLSKTFNHKSIKVISNKGWSQRGIVVTQEVIGGEQPIDIAYTIIALCKFYEVFKDPNYFSKIKIAFDWFLGNNHLHQILYNPCTGGCYDGLEQYEVNLNQGAESTLSYLMARIAADKYLHKEAVQKKLNNLVLTHF